VSTCPDCGAVLAAPAAEACWNCHRPLPRVASSTGDDLLDQLAADRARLTAPCGPSLRDGNSAPASGPSMLDFQRRLFELTPRVPVTHLIVAANIVVYLLLVVVDGMQLAFSDDTLITWGANDGPKTLAGQWWRLATCMFLHGNLLHIAMNMWVFRDLGRIVERLVGNTGFLILYLLSGLFGSLASVYWRPDVLSVGASGAVCGVFGGLMGFMLLRSDSVPKRVLSALRNSGLTFLVYNLIFGLSIKQIDMAAHVGGLVAGFLCGIVMSQRLALASPGRRAVRNLVTAGLGGAGLCLALAWAPAAPVDRRALRDALADFDRVEHEAGTKFEQLAQQHRAGQLSDDEFAAAIQQRVLPPCQRVCERLQGFKQIPPEDQRLIPLLIKYLQTRQEAWELRIQSLRTNDAGFLKKFKEKNDQCEALIDELNKL
jgi:rhomboid protease GluP